MKTAFIEQTAIDYDMNYEDVKKIYESFPECFYDKLEEYILNRSKLHQNHENSNNK